MAAAAPISGISLLRQIENDAEKAADIEFVLEQDRQYKNVLQVFNAVAQFQRKRTADVAVSVAAVANVHGLCGEELEEVPEVRQIVSHLLKPKDQRCI